MILLVSILSLSFIVSAVRFIDIDATLSNVSIGSPITIKWGNSTGRVDAILATANASSVPDTSNTEEVDNIFGRRLSLIYRIGIQIDDDFPGDVLDFNYIWTPSSILRPGFYVIKIKDNYPSWVFSPRFELHNSSSTANSDSKVSHKGLSAGAKAGIGVGVAVGSLILGALVFWLGRRSMGRKSLVETPQTTEKQIDTGIVVEKRELDGTAPARTELEGRPLTVGT
jgi:hypothetical protein